ncbi:GL26168 [Drosophila persimilis]|uniref:GL26168 n=1 Tax=Drosophila persimilis TaxID=7234 RepID=B4GKV1_DROPE|nr:ionotropic receptor 40a [Drosophila persimilis]EDW37267.1 GL26168 [Drosophila persimilis]
MQKLLVLLGLLLSPEVWTRVSYRPANESDVAIALSQIINGLRPRPLAILALPSFSLMNACCENDQGIQVDDFIQRLHRLYYKSVIFNDTELFFQHIEANLQGAIECVNLVLDEPKELSERIQERRLAHRLSLFIFYWGARWPPAASAMSFEEPMRAVVITRPRQKAFRIYYNQARPTSDGELRLVNWFDGDNLGLQRTPLLPPAGSVYANFEGRIFRVPVFHSPPWFWVSYGQNNSDSGEGEGSGEASGEASGESGDNLECNEVKVTGGRDHRLLMLLAEHMNFRFEYIEAPGRTQGSLKSDDAKESNESFTGGIGLLQSRMADFFLGDVGLSWERHKAIEFSFFTLADSGAFATHAPRRLNEALAIMRPFKQDIWPYLILTIVFSGPIFYGIIAMPYIWRRRHVDMDVEQLGDLCIYMAYIKEITPCVLKVRRRRVPSAPRMPEQLFEKCIWFTLRLFLKQSCQELYHGYRAKFLTIVYWIAATYVLADVYSAQLTSQFARPAHEAPINTLQRLQSAMIRDGYRLYVEKESSSLEMLENGTELFRQLYALMRQQQPDGHQSFLIDSVEAGIKLIADGGENKAVLGGRETLYFNIQQYGAKNFQLSQKLYTRYSAVAVQIGCPFLDSLNDVLIHLFEGGILDKMTTAEYTAQSRQMTKDQAQQSKELAAAESANANSNAKSSEAQTQEPNQDSEIISALNLRMLQGAFIALGVGSLAAASMLLLELLFRALPLARALRRCHLRFLRRWRRLKRSTRLLTVRIFAPKLG